MKKKYKIITFLLLGCIGSYAQPVLNASDFTSDSYTAEVYSPEEAIPGLSPGGSGANQVWNFSTIGLIKDETFSVVPVASSPYASSFPTANYCFKSLTDLSEPYYEYCKISSTKFEDLGGSDGEYTNTYSDTSVLFQFPYTYNTVFDDTYQVLDQTEVYSSTLTYDGYGTVITPYETFTNVIRQKSEDSDGNTSYLWFKSNPFRQIMSWSSYDNGVTGSISVWRYTGLGVIKNNRDKTIGVYPNPANSMLNLKVPNSLIVERVVITDLTGKIVLQQNQNTNQINVENLTSGLYILSAFSGEEKFQSKFVKE